MHIFSGEVTDQATFEEFDKHFTKPIDTFRPISNRELSGQAPKKIYYVIATTATTFDALAETLKLSDREKEDLRLINGHYPAGEPKPGDWIKIIRQ